MKQEILNINNKAERDIVIKKLENFKSEEGDPWFQRAADFFLIAYHAYGMKLFDLLTLKWKYWNNNTITFPRRKLRKLQSGTHDVYVSEELSQLIMRSANKDKSKDAYIFPFLTPNLNDDDLLAEVEIFRNTMNKYLRKVSKILGIKKISFYDARRMFYKETQEVIYQTPDSIANSGIIRPTCSCNHRDHTKTLEALYLRNMNNFKFRAECNADVTDLKKLLPKATFEIEQPHKDFPDVVVTLTTDCHIDLVRKYMLSVVDGHVMVETLATVSEYTGDRTHYNTLLF